MSGLHNNMQCQCFIIREGELFTCQHCRNKAMKEQRRINRELAILTWVTKFTIKHPKIGGFLLTALYGKKVKA